MFARCEAAKGCHGKMTPFPGLGLGGDRVKAATENKDSLPISGKGVNDLLFGKVHFCYLNVVE